MNANEIVIKEGSQLTTAESCEDIKNGATVVDHLGKEINCQIRLFLKQKNDAMVSDDSRNTSINKETIISAVRTNFRSKHPLVRRNYIGFRIIES